MKSYEILAPAGCLEAIEPLCQAGADAVYVGLYGYSSRPASADLSIEQIHEAAKISHEYGVKLHVAVNSCIGNNEFPRLMNHLLELDRGEADSVIIADWGILQKAANLMKRTKVHASTLLGVYNAATVRFLQKMGCTRVVLSTNLYLDEIADIINSVPDMEYELIAGGGICFNDNRLCELPHVLSKGEFRVYCREQYALMSGNNCSQAPRIHSSAVDAASIMKQLIELGIYSFKIEGRTNNYHHVCKTVKRLADAAEKAVQDISIEESADFSTIHYIRRFVRR